MMSLILLTLYFIWLRNKTKISIRHFSTLFFLKKVRNLKPKNVDDYFYRVSYFRSMMKKERDKM